MRRGRTTTHENVRQLPLRFRESYRCAGGAPRRMKIGAGSLSALGRGRGVRVAPPHSTSIFEGRAGGEGSSAAFDLSFRREGGG
jgi:hypothetical protein